MPRRPSSRSARLDVAYRTGRSGEDEPTWIADDDELHDSYAEGRREHDDEQTDAKRRRAQDRRAHPPARKRTAARPATSEPAAVDEPLAEPEHHDEGPIERQFDRKLFEPGDGGGLLLGALLYAVGVAYLNEGLYGVQRWLSAKFLNHVLPRRDELGARRTRRTRPGQPANRRAA